jgi:hypothetical protein
VGVHRSQFTREEATAIRVLLVRLAFCRDDVTQVPRRNLARAFDGMG